MSLASSRPAAERSLQPFALPPFQFILLSFLIGCNHNVCKLFSRQHVYGGEQASSLSVAPETVPIHCVFRHLTIALRQERGRKGKSTSSGCGDHSRENNKEIKRWVNLPVPSFYRALVWLLGTCGEESKYIASKTSSIIQHCEKGKQLFMCLSEGGNKYPVLLKITKKNGERAFG